MPAKLPTAKIKRVSNLKQDFSNFLMPYMIPKHEPLVRDPLLKIKKAAFYFNLYCV